MDWRVCRLLSCSRKWKWNYSPVGPYSKDKKIKLRKKLFSGRLVVGERGSGMGFATFLVYLAVGVAVLFGLEYILKKWLKIGKVKISETEGRNINRWGRGIILVAALCLLPFALSGSLWQTVWFWISYHSVLSLFDAFLQWKYARESREYILTLIFWPVIVASFLLFAFWTSQSA